jgi:hypothetical protein
MLLRRRRTTNLRAELEKALSAQRVNRALDLYELIERQNPDEPRWPHRKGDLLQRTGRKADAVLAYERCVELYAAKGFVARAAAMAKVILAIDPSKDAIFERVDREAARRLHRQNRCVGVTTDEPLNAEFESPLTQTNRVFADAPPLITDRAAPSSEMRFTNANTTEDVGLDFADVELVRRPPPPEPLVSTRPSAGTLAQLPSMPLVADVPSDILEALVRESTWKTGSASFPRVPQQTLFTCSSKATPSGREVPIRKASFLEKEMWPGFRACCQTRATARMSSPAVEFVCFELASLFSTGWSSSIPRSRRCCWKY